MQRLYLSDLHLGPEHPALSRAFARWCRGPAAEADEVWILGDLFEYWVGDDVGLETYPREIEALARLSETAAVHFLPGNRDFLCGAAFARAAGLRLHREPVRLPGRPRVLLLHGDSLCTADREYQRYRRLVRQRWLQWLFLHSPRGWRANLAGRIRARSAERGQRAEVQAITDADPRAAERALRRERADVLVHGHTHRPARHAHRRGLRYVLPDWRPGEPGSHGWLQQCDEDFSFRTLAGWRP